MLAFPLVTTQFFSSGLIIVGKSFRYALVLTIGRDLRRTEMLINPLNFDSYIIRTQISQDASGKKSGEASLPMFIFSLRFKNIPVENCFIHAKGPNYEV